MSQQLADLLMIGLVFGPPALAGMGFAFAYWQIGNQLSIGVSGGTISLVSRLYGGENLPGITAATKQSVWIALVCSIPLTAVFWFLAPALIELIGAGPAALGFGTAYLQVMSLGIGFEFLNKIGSRVLVGMDDAVTPMYVRSVGAVVNVVLNAILIFWLGLGVVGAALGTVLATVLVTVLFVGGFSGWDGPIVGRFPVRIAWGRPLFDKALTVQLLRVSFPLVFRRLAQSFVIFPFLAIVSVFGTTAVATFEVARRLLRFMNAPGWGFSWASSSLVGQYLGRGDEDEAMAFGWDILRFAIVVYLAVSLVVFALAGTIAGVFFQTPVATRQGTQFIRVAAIAVLWLGIDGSSTGVLRAAGDTRWPFYGKFVGLYLVTLPIAYVGVVTPIGLTAVYVAFVAEKFVPAMVSFGRFRTGHWLAVSRRNHPEY